MNRRCRLFCRRLPCASIAISTTSPAFSVTRKRRSSFPSETHVRRGDRVVHGGVELSEKLGRNDLCPCGSGARFQALLHAVRPLRRQQPGRLLSGSSGTCRGFALKPRRMPVRAGCGVGGARPDRSHVVNNGDGFFALASGCEIGDVEILVSSSCDRTSPAAAQAGFLFGDHVRQRVAATSRFSAV